MIVVILNILVVHYLFIVRSKTQCQTLFEIVTLKQFEQEVVHHLSSYIVHSVVGLQKKVEYGASAEVCSLIVI